MVNFLELCDDERQNNPDSDLSVLKTGEDDIAVSLISIDVEKEDSHYCPEADIQGYVKCVGDDCILCKCGRKKTSRIFFPVLSITENLVKVLPVTTNRKPGALLPKLENAIRALMKGGVDSLSKTPLFISRKNYKNTVTLGAPLDEDDLEKASTEIGRFQTFYKEGDLGAVANRRLSKDELLAYPEIHTMARLKGLIKLDPESAKQLDAEIEELKSDNLFG